ncbi:MAG TPA: WecB/TagA/CpsF family glycosyltransferase [Nitrolancea sp.]|nr:WecB/TagA/CpsF family glycosyltransferase [Nitrolancea sp.]
MIAFGVGGAFDFLAGAVPRAPRIVRRFGFEWLYRLIRQPWRWRRQLALPYFAVLILIQRLWPARLEQQEHVW